jgi:hypothetical protein
MTSPPSKRISQKEIQELWNDGGYHERMNRGDFRIKRTVGRPRALILELYGSDTITVKTELFDKTDFKIATTHHYESPTGKILYFDKDNGILKSDGRLDPKRLYHDGIMYLVEIPKPQSEPMQ